MIRWARDFRLIPIVLIATVSLFALKVSGLVFDGGYTFAERMENHYKQRITVSSDEKVPDYPKIVVADSKSAPAAPGRPQSWARQMFNFNGDDGSRDITGSLGEAKPDAPPLKVSSKPPAPPTLEAGDTSVAIVPGRVASAGERALLESLKGRRQELDKRSREIDMRENLLKATEKRVEAKVAELKTMEAKVKALMGARDKQEEERFKSLVTMYENMKAKDAARIFDRLDLGILIDVSTAINPRKMSDILAQMTPEVAERLTVELADRADAVKKRAPNQLPKIQGTPNGQ
jgi:flagellar motility protein MotE (MotC chaperone)